MLLTSRTSTNSNLVSLILGALSGVLFACAFPNAAIGWLMFIALLPLFVALSRAPATSFRRWLLIPLAWAAVEYARTYLMSGFPWNLIAASIIDYAPLVQFDRVAGPYALGVLILLPSTLLAWLVVDQAARPTGIK